MSDPITILHVFGRMNRGGAEMRTLELLRHIDRRRFRFHFCTLAGVRGELDDELRALGSPVHSVRHGSFGFPRRFGSLLREHRFDVVYSHVLNYSGLILRLAAHHKVPIRAALLRSLHDGRADSLGRTTYRRLMRRWIDRYATNILAVGEGVMIGAWGPDWRADPRCEVIYNGLDVEPFHVEVEAEVAAQTVRREFDLPPDGPLYVHVGHMRKPKNHGRLIEIFAAVRRRQADASLLLVGHGERSVEQRLRQQAARLGLGRSVVFCGERTDVPRLLAAADAMIFPSLWEGLPGAVLEAASVGTPVLATDLPGVRDIATRLPLVRYLSLDELDWQWAAALENLAKTAADAAVREAARRDFRNSVFTIDQCAQRHGRIWEGAAKETALKPAA
ncbi:MAG: glycosyltransferase [Thermoguttaceae bacterium]